VGGEGDAVRKPRFTHLRMPREPVHPVVQELFEIMREQRVSCRRMNELAGWRDVGRWRKQRWSPTLRAISDCLAALGYELVVEKVQQNVSRETSEAA